MSETCVIEVYENQVFSRLGGWQPHSDVPFTMKPSNIPCKPLEEISLPSADWAWMTNWKTSKMPGVTDADGWEYASRFSRFQNKGRAPKAEAVWSRARRRLWVRVMRRDATIKSADLSKALSKVQTGLSSVHAARLKIEQVTKQAPDAVASEQMISLSNSVQRNIADLLSILDQAEAQPPGKTDISPAAVKKLRNDIMREEAAITKALEAQPDAASAPGSNKAAAPPTSSSGKVASNRTSSAELRHNLQGAATIARPKGVVQSGQKGAFDPSIFGGGGGGTSGGNPFDDQEGVFVERSVQELMIDQKLVAIDEATIMQEIIDDRSNEIKKVRQSCSLGMVIGIVHVSYCDCFQVHQGLVEINEMFVEISKLVKEQEVIKFLLVNLSIDLILFQ